MRFLRIESQIGCIKKLTHDLLSTFESPVPDDQGRAGGLDHFFPQIWMRPEPDPPKTLQGQAELIKY
jgi:hypothetical protein